MDEYRAANKTLWENWTLINSRSADYDLEGFRAGKISLRNLEMGEVGDVRGKSLLHLQCHFGKDTLSWAKLGATVTGVDFSENAINLARSLSDELDIPARFILSELYNLPEVLDEKFDIVFTSYGVLGWLPDIPRWGELVGHFLKPGGVFYVVEVHPFAWTFEEEGDPPELKLRYPYFQGSEPLRFEVKGSYADPDADYTGVEYDWNHTMSSIINALISAGLRIEFMHEFPFLAWKAFGSMVKDAEGWYRIAGNDLLLPLMFSIRATKPLESE